MVVLFIQILNKKKERRCCFFFKNFEEGIVSSFHRTKYQRHRTYKGLYKDGRYGSVEQIEFIKGSSAYNNQFESSLKQIINNRRK